MTREELLEHRTVFAQVRDDMRAAVNGDRETADELRFHYDEVISHDEFLKLLPDKIEQHEKIIKQFDNKLNAGRYSR